MKNIFFIILLLIFTNACFSEEGLKYFGQASVPIGVLTCPFGVELALGIKLFDAFSIGIGGGGAPFATGLYWLCYLQYDLYPFVANIGFFQSGINMSIIPGAGFRIELLKGKDGGGYFQMIVCYDITLQKYQQAPFYNSIDTNPLYRFNIRISIVSEQIIPL